MRLAIFDHNLFVVRHHLIAAMKLSVAIWQRCAPAAKPADNDDPAMVPIGMQTIVECRGAHVLSLSHRFLRFWIGERLGRRASPEARDS